VAATGGVRRRLVLVLLSLLVPLVVGYMTGVVPGVSDYAGSAVCASGPAVDVPEGAAAGGLVGRVAVTCEGAARAR